MDSFFLGAALFLCLLILPCLYRMIVGPTIIDRMVAVGAIGTKTLIILVLMGFPLRPHRHVHRHQYGLRHS